MVTYNGLETCIINNQALEKESGTRRGDECLPDSFDDDGFSSCSSSKDVSESFSSEWIPRKSNYVDWDFEKPSHALCYSDVKVMKEKFSKLLLGEDVTGGCKSVQSALALSNAITHLSHSIFGELWKFEPLSEDKKQRWRMEMDWLLSPTKYMIELVPSKQDGEDGRSLEIMIPKARVDIHMNLPALRKLDTMLIETLDSAVNTEFWYSEVGRKAEGTNKITRESKKWWLPSPKVPKLGLSSSERMKLVKKGNVVYQIFKAAKSINKNVLLEMPVPTIIKDALPKSGKTSLGDDLYKMLASESCSVDEIFISIRLVTEHASLEIVNKLEAAIYTWKERITEQASIGKSPMRASWSLVRDSLSEIELLINRAERLNDQIKSKFSNLPQSFLDASKIQYGKDIGHGILEAYSRILANLAFRILSRIEEILQEDALSNPGEAHVNINKVQDGTRIGPDS